ncbi:MAG: NADH-quinone oxidoreductase subunit L [Bacteroidota bacterium]
MVTEIINSNWTVSFTIAALCLPLISFTLACLIPTRYSWIVTITSLLLLFVSMVMACSVSLTILNNHEYWSIATTWFSLSNVQFTVGFHLDSLTVLMLPVVTIVSFLVHLYSTGYMAGDKNVKQYFAMLGFFTFSMLGLILADNLLLLFVFWELVGFSSYMLIGHWYDKPAAGAASKKAFIFNRIGDAGFLIGLMIIWANAGSFNIESLHHVEIYSWQTAATLCLFCGVIGKSAQFPLLTWLPDAMEGPTPVSALIHAATMVAAGVYLLAKLFFLFTPEALQVVTIIGTITALMASLSALVQTDIKKILAYSTLSQLGFMVLAVGTGSPHAAMLHLFTHAFFKAGLFLGAGAIIHSLHQLEHHTHQHFDVQDIRVMGGLRKELPVTFITFLICSAALSGLPFFSGFLSKDVILNSVTAWAGASFSWKWFIVISAFAIPFLTMLYTFRLIWFVFFGENRTKAIIGQAVKFGEVPFVMRMPLIVLSVCSLWFIVSPNPSEFHGWLYHTLSVTPEDGISLTTVISAGWVLLALAVSYFYFRNRSIESSTSALSQLLYNSFYLDRIYEVIITTPVNKITTFTEKIDSRWVDGFIHATVLVNVTFAHVISWFDKYIVDGGVNGMARVAGSVGSVTRSFQGGKIQLYIFWAVLGIIIFLISMLI